MNHLIHHLAAAALLVVMPVLATAQTGYASLDGNAGQKPASQKSTPADAILVSSDYDYGIYLGAGGVFPTSRTADYFKGCAVFQIGLTGSYDNFRLKTDVHFGQPSFKQSNMWDVKDAQGHDLLHNSNADASYLGWSAQVGYTVWQGNRVAVTPNVGCYYSKYSWDVDSLKWGVDEQGKEFYQKGKTWKEKKHSWGFIASVDIDIQLSSTVTATPFMGNGDKRFTSSLRISPFITYANYSKHTPVMKGCTVGFTVSYLGLLRSLSM